MRPPLHGYPEILDPATSVFFVDFDDTLIEPQPDPVAFVLPATLRMLVAMLAGQKHFKLVITTGRSIAQIDALFAPYRFPVIGCHGAEMRMANAGPVQSLSLTFPETLRNLICALASKRNWLVEIKEFGMAVHCLAPEQDMADAVQTIEPVLGSASRDWYLCLTGRCIDVRARNASKGSAIQLFRRHPFYANRRLVYIGDDALRDPSLTFLEEDGGLLLHVEKPDLASRGQGFIGPHEVRAFLECAIRAC